MTIKDKRHQIALSTVIVSLGIALGRLMGLIRETSLISIFGISEHADIAVLTLTVPDILVNLLVAGGLSAALIPEFKSFSKEDAYKLFIQASILSFFAISAVVYVLQAHTNILLNAFAPGIHGSNTPLAKNMLSVVIWLIPFTVLSGVTTAYLQAQNKFLMPALGTLIFNTLIVIGLFIFVKSEQNILTLTYVIILAGICRWLSQFLVTNSPIKISAVFSNMVISASLFKRYFQAIVAVGLLSLFPVVSRSYASLTGEGHLAVMNYALRLVEFPLGIMVTVLSVVLFPRLSDMHARENKQAFLRLLTNGLIFSVGIAALIAIPIAIFAKTYVSLAFSLTTNITPKQISSLSELVSTGILILPCQGIIAMLTSGFNAQKKTRIPLVINGIGFCILIFLNSKTHSLTEVMDATLLAYLLVSIMFLLVRYIPMPLLNKILFLIRQTIMPIKKPKTNTLK